MHQRSSRCGLCHIGLRREIGEGGVESRLARSSGPAHQFVSEIRVVRNLAAIEVYGKSDIAWSANWSLFLHQSFSPHLRDHDEAETAFAGGRVEHAVTVSSPDCMRRTCVGGEGERDRKEQR